MHFCVSSERLSKLPEVPSSGGVQPESQASPTAPPSSLRDFSLHFQAETQRTSVIRSCFTLEKSVPPHTLCNAPKSFPLSIIFRSLSIPSATYPGQALRVASSKP